MRRIFLGCFPFSSFLLRHDVCCDLHFPPTLHYSSILLFQVLFLICRHFPVFLPCSAPSSLPGSWTIGSCRRASSSSGPCPPSDSPEHPGGPRASHGVPSGEGGGADPAPKETAPGGNSSTGLPEYLHSGLPQGCTDKQKKGEGGGGQGCSAEMFVCLLAQTPVWASPAGASVVLGGNCLFSLHSPWNVQLSTVMAREMLKAMGRQCWQSNSQGRIPSFCGVCCLGWVPIQG